MMTSKANRQTLPALLLAFGLWLLVLGGSASAQIRTELKGIVPGSELGWEIQELRASIVVTKPTIINLQIYSPGFDPKDYRSALKGKPELGDERYDRGRGNIKASFRLLRDSQVLQSQSYGVEPHRWVLFYRGMVQPGIYSVGSSLEGLGKNAFIYRIQTSVANAAELLVDPTLQLYDVRRDSVVSLSNVRGPQWVEPFVLEVLPGVGSFKVGIYDEDGKSEMLGRVTLPDGQIVPRVVSGDRQWSYVDVNGAGTYRFGFAQPLTAKQYSNTVGFQVNACMQIRGNQFAVLPAKPIQASVVDEAGKRLEFTPNITGDQVREVEAPALPDGYILLRAETQGGEVLAVNKVRLGCAGGLVRFVVAPPRIIEIPAEPQMVEPSAPTPTLEPISPPVVAIPETPAPALIEVLPTPEVVTPPTPEVVPPKPEVVPPTPEVVTPPKPEVVPPPAKTGRLELSAKLVLPSGEQNTDLPIRVGQQTVSIRGGSAALDLPEGEVVLEPLIQGATIIGPSSAQIQLEQTAKAEFKVYPNVKLELSTDKTLLKVGEEAVLTATASTAFARILPADIRLLLPPCLDPLDSPRITTPVSASRQGVLQVRVRAICRGEMLIPATLSPWNQQAEVQIKVIQPLSFNLTKEALSPSVAVGAEAVYRLTVQNTSDEAGSVRLRDALGTGLQGNVLEQTLTLEPGQSQTVELRATVAADAPEVITNQAQLLDAADQVLAQAAVKIQVLRPVANLSRSLDKKIVVPGEVIEVTLNVSNSGQTDLTYTLSDSIPEWLEVFTTPEFSGSLAPGQSRSHSYRAKVRFGSDASGQFQADLRSNGGNPSAPDTLKRVLLPLRKTVQPERMVIGGEAEFLIEFSNPTDHRLAFNLQEAPDPDLGVEVPDNLSFSLEPGQSQTLTLKSLPKRVGNLENQVSAFVGDTPISFPSKAVLAVLPQLEALRYSQVTLDFALQNTLQGGERLLLTQLPPSQASFEPGSARLDGRPVSDPLTDSEGRLYFELPLQAQGVLTFTLRHREALPPLNPPTLTLRSGEREVQLQGSMAFEALDKAKPLEAVRRDGYIQSPQPGTLYRVDKFALVVETPFGLETQIRINGETVDSRNLGQGTFDSIRNLQRFEYFGLPLRQGRNVIEVQTQAGSDRVEVFLPGQPQRLEARPLQIQADGRTPLEFELRAVDADGLPVGFGPLTVQSSLEPLLEDAFPSESGYQVLLRDGRAILKLQPSATPTTVQLKLAFNQLKLEQEFFAIGRQGSLAQLQGSVGIRIADALYGFGNVRGYLETPLMGGILRAATDASLSFENGNPIVVNGLNAQPTPSGRFPLSGAGTEAALPLPSADPVAFRFDQEGFGLGYYAGALALPALSELPQGTALRLETRGAVQAQGFVGLLPIASIRQEIVPDGTRYYRLSQPAAEGSESLILRIGAEETKLVAMRDYALDAPSGIITLARPLWPSDPDFKQVRLIVTYAPENTNRALGFGVGLRYRVGGFSLGAGLAQLPLDNTSRDLRYGLEAGYQSQGFSLRLSYLQAQQNKAGLELNSSNDLVELSANLTLQNNLQGQARIAYNLSPDDKLSLEHQASGVNQTGVLYTRKLNSNFSLGGGLGYIWEEGSLAGLLRVASSGSPLTTELTHSQPFSLSAQALTRLRGSYAFDANLSAEAEITNAWGSNLSGTIGLKQKLDAANLSLSYQLPGASGQGNRARFGLETPLALTDRLGLNLSAGYEQSLSTGDALSSLGAALRYKSEDFSATLGAETALTNGQPKVVLRSGATGQLDALQTLSFDATYQVVPTNEGRFTLGYALRGQDLSLLTYHRLITSNQPIIEGALTANIHPDNRFQLRPSAAYSFRPLDQQGNTYQLGLGANYYFTDWWGLGGGVYYQIQPGLGRDASAFGLESSFRIVDGLWFNLGYTFAGFDGLTTDTRPGFYLRLDFLTGNR